ncbi:hypothetical protein [Legionella shakespearei]|uniref:Uncharacterized protein n=1 Tax=Legionella shakespearei DSM 23087 TaxID=1122169 RepID=A0A0W0YTN6_9GAMM|nr:hypothetical protein [Legionella shakespearei]KTD60014.1 hypothetical protein Lsha_1764 [Legionella shakespearei DSM 23087]
MNNLNKYLIMTFIAGCFLSNTLLATGSNNSNKYAQSRLATAFNLSEPDPEPPKKNVTVDVTQDPHFLERSTITLSEPVSKPATTTPSVNIIIPTTGIVVDFQTQTQNQMLVTQNTSLVIVNYVPVITGIAISCMVP